MNLMQEQQVPSEIREQASSGDRVPPQEIGRVADSLKFVAEIIGRYGIRALGPLFRACESGVQTQQLTVAVLGRFKAGKSSFLNQVIGRDLLPVGVVPVTSVVTEILWGERECIEVSFLDTRAEIHPVSALAQFVAESENPENKKGVRVAQLLLPELAAYKTLRFVDTPGLDSALAHNTETAVSWFPNVDVALVTIGVDPPLSQQDVALIRNLLEYTPSVCVLLTKVDVLSDSELATVLQFVESQLNRNFRVKIDVFPYSTRSGFEHFRTAFKQEFLRPVLSRIHTQKSAIVAHKTRTLLREASDFVRLRLRSAELVDSERQRLRARIQDAQAVTDAKLELQLMARHAISGARRHIEAILKPYEKEIAADLRSALKREYAGWRLSFARLLEQFEHWLRQALVSRLSSVSAANQREFLKPLEELQRRQMRVLQAFRDRLSERTMKLFGVPLRTIEPPFELLAPKPPDVNIGRVFDHSWELLSPVLPMAVMRRPVKNRFLSKVNQEVFKNLSRLTTQWLDILTSSVKELQHNAERRIDDLVATVERLTASPNVGLPQIAADLEQLEQKSSSLSPGTRVLDPERTSYDQNRSGARP